ncbi:polyubiquitin-tagged protein recognition complex Npl4 component [Cristinia sonorae]|uniref:Nuclear protein localization protein 4 n=1 Tax=Cristinia sonorae TaxID=1940300 RepID=A0A8K0UFV2_9AGAR|nr:polyubiquitin-tagged protein recognition complex Npl4 component [Cristinia sonorae]
MLIRVRSKDGNFRFDCSPNETVGLLVAKILETTTDADPTTLTISNQPRGNETLASGLANETLASIGLKHGDLVFVTYQSQAAPSSSAPKSTTEPAAPSNVDQPKRIWETVVEDPVDQYWRSQDGKIPRSRDTRFCKHGANAMCDYCMPLEPYDPAYHTEHNIKHLSYHAYLQKLQPKGSKATSTTSMLPPLNQLNYKVKVPCPSGGHPNWPAGICTACQPSAITLQSQPFRMVDHLEIASPDIVERFLQSWRNSAKQRFGWMIGRYEPYDKVPMGVKAVVEAIYEPPQEGFEDGIQLHLPWEEEQRIRELAKLASTPLSIVGYIFTDIVVDPEDRTVNIYKRHPQSFFLAGLEALFAATVQNANPTPSRSSPTGQFASRIVTAVLTGTEDGNIDISAYQVSEQACAMVDADMIEASVDPGIIRVKEEDRRVGSARYVPDVFFRYKNEYGLEVKKSAKPCFPVEYLLVNVSHGFPQTPSPMFRSTVFAIENRKDLYELQSTENVVKELSRLGAPDLTAGSFSDRRSAVVRYLSDWHLIAFLETTQLISQEDMKVLVKMASAPDLDDPSVLDSFIKTESWETLMTFARESAPARSGPTGSHTAMDEDIPPEILEQIAREEEAARAAAGGADSPVGNIRICPHCTFENSHGGGDCEVCGLPL